MRRPPKDKIKRFFASQYSNYGSKFFELLFGSHINESFKTAKTFLDVIDRIATAFISKYIELE